MFHWTNIFFSVAKPGKSGGQKHFNCESEGAIPLTNVHAATIALSTTTENFFSAARGVNVPRNPQLGSPRRRERGGPGRSEDEGNAMDDAAARYACEVRGAFEWSHHAPRPSKASGCINTRTRACWEQPPKNAPAQLLRGVAGRRCKSTKAPIDSDVKGAGDDGEGGGEGCADRVVHWERTLAECWVLHCAPSRSARQQFT